MVRKCWENTNIFRVNLPKINLTIDSIISSKDSDAGSHVDPIRKEIKYGTSLQAAKGIFLEYFNESTIHGFKYIGDQKRSILERIIWLFALISSIVTCCFLIRNIFDKYHNTPIITTFNEKPTALWEIPFPSVTICPEAKSRSNIFNFTEVYYKIKDEKNLTQKEQFHWEAISQICSVRPLRYGNDYANASELIASLSEVFPDPLDGSCVWRKEKCFECMHKMLTKEGICYTFNKLNGNYFIRNEFLDVMTYDTGNNVSGWNLENGYSREAGSNTFPFRAQATGEEDLLVLLFLSKNSDSDILCSGFNEGYKVIFHTPGELPQVSKNFLRIPLDQSALISVKPKILNTSDELKDFDANRRQCYFQEERFLRFFKIYSKANCELECLTNRTLEECECVKFSMPRNASHAVCGSRKLRCLSNVEKNFLFDKFKDTDKCNCLPSCKSVQYSAELEYQTPISFLKIASAVIMDNKATPAIMGFAFTEVKISFKAESFYALKRSKLYSTTDFIANCGGLLGLFMGVSILSLVELVYFFTIRLWANLKMRKAKQKEIRQFKENA